MEYVQLPDRVVDELKATTGKRTPKAAIVALLRERGPTYLGRRLRKAPTKGKHQRSFKSARAAVEHLKRL